MSAKANKVVLAYSGGLDTSIIIPWLKDNYGAEVIAFAADVGQGAELSGLEEKAIRTGASKCIIEDLRDEFVSEFVFPTLRAGAIYERKYICSEILCAPVDRAPTGGNSGAGRRRRRLARLHRQGQ
jgi:argininosuccinate synthase